MSPHEAFTIWAIGFPITVCVMIFFIAFCDFDADILAVFFVAAAWPIIAPMAAAYALGALAKEVWRK